MAQSAREGALCTLVAPATCLSRSGLRNPQIQEKPLQEWGEVMFLMVLAWSWPKELELATGASPKATQLEAEVTRPVASVGNGFGRLKRRKRKSRRLKQSRKVN